MNFCFAVIVDILHLIRIQEANILQIQRIRILSTGGLQVGLSRDIEEEINKSVFSAEDGDQGVFPKFSTQILMTLELKTLE